MITQSTLIEIATANRQLAVALEKAFKELEEPTVSEYVGMKEAEQISGMNSARIRYLIRLGKIRSQRLSERVIMVNRSDLQNQKSCLV